MLGLCLVLKDVALLVIANNIGNPKVIIQSDRNHTCTMAVLKGFIDGQSYENFLEVLKKVAKDFDDGTGPTLHDGTKANQYGGWGLEKIGIISATTTDAQESAERNLEEFGFSRLVSQKTRKYGTVLTLWGMPSPEFHDRLWGDR